MNRCIYLSDEFDAICTNAHCPCCADACACLNYTEICKYAEPDVVMNVYDEVEEHKDCTVQILRNSVTGEISIGWYENNNERKND